MGMSQEMDFTPVPPRQRVTPARTRSVPARLYVDRWREHREAYQYLQEVQKLYGAGAKTLVRALLHYKDTVAEPLEKLAAKAGGRPSRLPDSIRAALREFQPIKGRGQRIKHISVRLYIDRWAEHREAYEFLQRQQKLSGDGNKTIVRAILHYRDSMEQEQ